MQELIQKIEVYRVKHRLEPTTVGWLLAGDPNLLRDLEEGERNFRLATLGSIEDNLARHPDELRAERTKKKGAA